MKIEAKVIKVFDIRFLRMNIPIRYDDKSMQFDFPLRDHDSWDVVIDIDKGRIIDYKNDEEFYLSLKVTDTGSYYLYDEDMSLISSIENNYVPNGIIPGAYGDYIMLNIDKDGIITNWPETLDFSDFLELDD